MKAAFVVTLDIADNEDRNLLAQELLEELTDAGFSVDQVNPWDAPQAQPTLNPGTYFTGDAESVGLF